MTYTKKQKEEYAILSCRYYNGEEENPFYDEISKHTVKMDVNGVHGMDEYDVPYEVIAQLHTSATAFNYEQWWVGVQVDDPKYDFSGDISEYLCDVKTDFAAGDGTPISLRATFYNRYVHWALSDYVTEEGIESFKSWYKAYCSKPTHREIRAEKRKPGLIQRCKYYAGEESNPWELCYSPVLVWRREIWEIEKNWVQALSLSYQSDENKTTLIENWHLAEFFKYKDIPLSLTNMILKNQQKKSKEENVEFGPAEAIKHIDKYLKLAPLGHGAQKYFAYYLGEEKDPYPSQEKDYRGLFWLQESIINRHINTDFLLEFGKELVHPSNRNIPKEGVLAWMYDQRYPLEQRSIWNFCAANIATWMPYENLEEIGEQYINFHYVRPKRGRK